VRDRGTDHRHRDHVALGDLHALADRFGHLACLPDARADAPVHVADHDQSAERELAATLDHLGDAVDADNAVRELRSLSTRVRVSRSHLVLKLQSGFARSVSQSLDSAVIKESTPVEHDLVHAGCLGLGSDLLADLDGFGQAVAL